MRHALIAVILAGAAAPALAADYRPVSDAMFETLHVAPKSAAEVKALCDTRLAAVETAKSKLEAMPLASEPMDLLAAYDDLYVMALTTAYTEPSLIQQSSPDKAIRDAGADCVARGSTAITRIGMSRPIYERLQKVAATPLDADLRYMVATQLDNYRRAGVDRDEATRKRIAELSDQITAASIEFSKNIAEDVRSIEATPAELEGLPEDFLAKLPPAENGVIRIAVTGANLSPVMQYAKSEALRKRMLSSFQDRAFPANDAVFKRLLALRAEQASLLGYPNYAAFDHANRMAKDPARVQAFIDDIAGAARPIAEAEATTLLARLNQDGAGATALPSWSTSYASRLVKKEQFDVDPEVVRQYFDYDKVKGGIFELTQDLFGVSIRPWQTAVWAPEVEAYELVEKGEVIGRFYLDMHPRDGKFTHAAMFPVRVGIEDRVVPVAALLTNFPTGLMEHGQVVTFLHEFGHLLHWMFAGQVEWGAQNFGEIEADVTEAPSQLLEEWVWDYDTLSRFATNAKGETIPADLVAKMNAARRFGEALGTMGQLGYAQASLDYYAKDQAGADLTQSYYDAYRRHALTQDPAGIHPHASFGHLTGYAASYYTYQWSKALASDLLGRFRSAGLRDPATARAYREMILAPGGSNSMNVLARNFLGRDWSVDAYRAELELGRNATASAAAMKR